MKRLDDKNKFNLIFNEVIKCDENISKSYRILYHLEYLFIRLINIYNS